jgi:outer membrane lipoprotein SlyB
MKAIQAVIATFLTAAALVSGCANTDSRYGSNDSRYGSSQSYADAYGVIDAIETIQASAAGIGGIGVGTVIGGVVGGVLGNQVGSGRGKTVATVAGAVGGAVVGHEIEKANRTNDAYRIRVRFDNGSYQTVTQDSINDLRVGDRVRVENDRVYRY